MMNSKLTVATLMAVASLAALDQSVRNDTVQDVPSKQGCRASGTRSPSARQRKRAKREAVRNAKQLERLHESVAKRNRKACE